MQLNIPQPCQQNYHDMQPVQEGRFCASCAKRVIDFTNYSNAQLVDFFKKYPNGVCGRLRHDQLQNCLQNKPAHRSRVGVPAYLLGLGLSLFFPARNAEASMADTVPLQLPVNRLVPLVSLPVLSTISGIITDTLHHPIDGALVRVFGTTLRTVSDVNGRFFLKLPDSLARSHVQIEVEAAGCLGQLMGVPVTAPEVKVQMQPDEPIFLGKIATTGAIWVKRSWWQKIKDWFR